MAAPNLDIKIDGDHILQAYATLKSDLGQLFTYNPDRRVEFVMGNTTDMHWRNLGTFDYAGGWVRGANPSEDLLPHHAIGAAVESHGGGAGAALAFYCDLPKKSSTIPQTLVLVVFGYCPKTASNRVEGYLLKLPTVLARTIEMNAAHAVREYCDQLEDLGGDKTAWSAVTKLDDTADLSVNARYSGSNDGLVEITITSIPRTMTH
jgi:hypothetical protein